jgi:hypothetical protein
MGYTCYTNPSVYALRTDTSAAACILHTSQLAWHLNLLLLLSMLAVAAVVVVVVLLLVLGIRKRKLFCRAAVRCSYFR